ncbi:MAG: TIGR01212 family radical SAM protein [Ruminococcus sp.]
MDHPRYFSAGAYSSPALREAHAEGGHRRWLLLSQSGRHRLLRRLHLCSGGSGHFTPSGTIPEQIAAERTRIAHTHPDAGIIAYFQAHTNTYGTPEHLRRCYTLALAQDGVEALAIGTRPDCLPEPVLDVLSDIAEQTALTVELGLQTIHDATAEQFRRGYGFDQFLHSFQALRERHIRICVHLINGLPSEMDADMLETARVVGRLRPDAVKIHLLHILRGTPLAAQWRAGRIPVLSQGEYVQITAAQLALLPPETVIERLTGDGAAEELLAPRWSLHKTAVRNAIARHLKYTDTWQGKNFIP